MIGDTIRANAGGPVEGADRAALALIAAVVAATWLLAVVFGAG